MEGQHRITKMRKQRVPWQCFLSAGVMLLAIAAAVLQARSHWLGLPNAAMMLRRDDDCRLEGVHRFCSWLLESPGLLWPAHTAPIAKAGSVLGLRAMHDIAAGQLLFTVPGSLFLSSAKAFVIFDEVVPRQEHLEVVDANYLVLALALCLELGSGDTSALAPFLSTFSTTLDPLPSAEESERLKTWLTEASASHPSLPLPTFERLAWAVSTVRSKAIFLPPGLSDRGDGAAPQPVLIPLMDVVIGPGYRSVEGLADGRLPGVQFKGGLPSSGSDDSKWRVELHAPHAFKRGEAVDLLPPP